MSWYSTGTVNVSNGSPTVTGVGTAWVGVIDTGWGFVGPDGRTYQVLTVNANTSITLARNYAGANATGAQYDLFPTQGLVRSLTEQVVQLRNDYSSVLTGAGAGKFADGTNAAPGISFASDVDTGFRRPSANAISMVTGAADRVTVDASGNVGIGTQSPAVNFEVMAAAAQANIAVRADTGQTAAMNVIGNGNALGATSLDLVQDSSNVGYLFNRANAALVFGTNNAERVRLDAAGNLIPTLTNAAPSLSVPGQLVLNRVNDTTLRFSMRGADGVTRSGDLTLS